jgi:hypothetical protein
MTLQHSLLKGEDILRHEPSLFSPAGEPSRQDPSTWKNPKTGLQLQYESPGKIAWHKA